MFHTRISSPTLPVFPSDALPGLLGDMLRGMTACGINPAISGPQLLGFASLLTQGIADVEWPDGQRMPIGISVLLVAPSGAGKSRAQRLIQAPIQDFLAQHSNDWQNAFLLEDATREAILQHLKNWPCAGLVTDEGGQLKGLLRQAPTLAKLLDGDPLLNARVSTGRIALLNHRFMMMLLEQPEVFETTRHLLGARQGGVGLLNRFFVACALTQPATPAFNQAIAFPAIQQQYAARVNQLLAAAAQNVADKIAPLPLLQLSLPAQSCLPSLDRDLLRGGHPRGASWNTISEYASRHTERTLRLAGALHAYEHGATGRISEDTLLRADRLERWSLAAFQHLTYTPPKLSKQEIDAATLARTLRGIMNDCGDTSFPLASMRRYAPNLGLTKPAFDRAVAQLAKQGKAQIVPGPGCDDWLEIIPYALTYQT